jgi:hypothetical protein
LFFIHFLLFLFSKLSDIAGALHANPWLSIMLSLAERTPDDPERPLGDTGTHTKNDNSKDPLPTGQRNDKYQHLAYSCLLVCTWGDSHPF